MKHLPSTTYSSEDQRADKAFLVGADFGRAQERERIKALLHEAGIYLPEGVEV